MSSPHGALPIPRSELDLPADLLWVQHCSEGPVPRRAVEAVRGFLEKELHPWDLEWEGEFLGLPRRVRRRAGRLLGARVEDLTLVPTTSAGLALVAQGLDWREGDEVVLPLGEFPANYWPWRSLETRGVRVREVPLWDGHRAGREAWSTRPPPPGCAPEERLLAALGRRTRLVSASWVRFQDGLRLDLGRLAAGCAERDVLLVVDGIQGAGTVPVELAGGADGPAAFAAGGYKGLLAPQGLGVLWTRADVRRRLAPPGGWLSLEAADDFSRPSTDFDRSWAAGGERLEGGVPNLLGCAALAASLELLLEGGVESLARHVAALADDLLARSADRGPVAAEAGRLRNLAGEGRLGSILAFHHGGLGSEALLGFLAAGEERGIHASVREGYLRIALHGWHDGRDVERLAEWLATWPDGSQRLMGGAG